MKIGKRLEKAILEYWPEIGGPGTKTAFLREIGARLKGGKSGVTKRSLSNYTKGEHTPSLEYLECAADITGVRKPWLICGDGEPTADEQRIADHARVMAAAETLTLEDQALDEFVAEIAEKVKGYSTGDDRKAEWRKAAVIRFLWTMRDANTIGAPWLFAEDRAKVLEHAMRFLVLVDGFFAAPEGEADDVAYRDEVADLDMLLLRDSSSVGWYVVWSGAVLDLFARRVIGLGVRAGGWDAHRPAASYLWPTSAEQHLVRVLVNSIATDDLELPDGTHPRETLRFAPSFKLAGTGDHPYTARALANFLGWNERKMQQTLDNLAKIEEHNEQKANSEAEEAERLERKATAEARRLKRRDDRLRPRPK